MNQSKIIEYTKQTVPEPESRPTFTYEKTNPIPITPEVNSIEKKVKIWVNGALLIKDLNEIIEMDNFEIVSNRNDANFWIERTAEGEIRENVFFQKVYVLSVPYTQLITEISKFDLLQIISNSEVEPISKIWIKPEDYLLFHTLFIDFDLSRFIVSESIPENCIIGYCFRICSLEDIEPFWKVVDIDKNHPLHKDFQIDQYPLVYRLKITPNSDEKTGENPITLKVNDDFDRDLITTVILTGTTAFVRNTALKIEENGLGFPTQNLLAFLSSADVTHISYEVPFYSKCPPAIPLRKEMRFCSDPAYIQILNNLGVDIVELTGNHLLDWGPDAFFETLELYKRNKIPYYGGGIDQKEAAEPFIKIINGNKFVFLGCNLPGPDNNWATDTRPGASKCDFNSLKNEIKDYRNKGYLPIVTIQHFEIEDFVPLKQLRDDFSSLADAGAVIVSGSQAHFPQGIDFVNGSFIHFGVGNLFFDQMDNWLRKSTIDVHYFYKGRYINTELIPIINEDFGQPRFMTKDESNVFFEKMYEFSFYHLTGNR